MTSRRDFLAASAAALAALAVPRVARPFGDATQVDVAELDLGPGTTTRPNAWKRLLYEVRQTTSVECVARAVTLSPDDPALFEHPFAVVQGSGAFGMPNEAALQQISRYLSYGGFLLFDEITGAERSGFDDSVRALIDALFPTRSLAPIPADHSIYRSFFLNPRPVGRIDQFGWLEGVTSGTNTPVVYSRNDLSGALHRDDVGRQNPVVPGGEHQRREAVKLAINLVMYALTSNYKKDQAHVRQLMIEGRLE